MPCLTYLVITVMCPRSLNATCPCHQIYCHPILDHVMLLEYLDLTGGIATLGLCFLNLRAWRPHSVFGTSQRRNHGRQSRRQDF